MSKMDTSFNSERSFDCITYLFRKGMYYEKRHHDITSNHPAAVRYITRDFD